MGTARLNEKAVLVSLKIRKYGISKEDKDISLEVARNHQASSTDAGKYLANKFNKNAFKKISAIEVQARNYHLEATLPWANEGQRMLPSKRYLPYMTEIKQIESEFWAERDALVAKLKDLVEEAKTLRGNMFNPNQYPTEDEFKNSFEFRIKVLPIPEVKDFRIDLADEEIDAMKSEMEEELRLIQADGVKTVYNRLYEVVKRMANTLSQEDKQFHKSMVGNIKELCDALPDFNIYNDQNLENLRQEVMEKLVTEDIDSLRTDLELRKDVATDAEEILKKMEGYC